MIIKRDAPVYGLIVTIKHYGKGIKKIIDNIDRAALDILFVNYHHVSVNRFKLLIYFSVEEKAVLDKIVYDIKQYGFVEDVKILQPKIPGFLIDTESFPLRLGLKQRAIVIGDIIYRGLLTESRKKFGNIVEAFLFYLGYFGGEEAAKSDLELGSTLGIKDPKIILSAISAPLFKALGYCSIELVKLDPNGTSIIRVYDSFECEIGKPSDKPFSHLLRGFIAGLFSGLFKAKYTAKEIMCIAKGDPYCEFVITKVGVKEARAFPV